MNPILALFIAAGTLYTGAFFYSACTPAPAAPPPPPPCELTIEQDKAARDLYEACMLEKGQDWSPYTKQECKSLALDLICNAPFDNARHRFKDPNLNWKKEVVK